MNSFDSFVFEDNMKGENICTTRKYQFETESIVKGFNYRNVISPLRLQQQKCSYIRKEQIA